VLKNKDNSEREVYIIDKPPDMVVKNTILPGRKYVVWIGKTSIYCPKTGLSADLTCDFNIQNINTIEGYIYQHSSPLNNNQQSFADGTPIIYLRGHVGHEIYKRKLPQPISGCPDQERHHRYHKEQHQQYMQERAEQAEQAHQNANSLTSGTQPEKPQQGYGAWMWKGLTAATTAVASTVAPAYMRDPESDILVSLDDILLYDFTKIEQCLALYPEEPDPSSSVVCWAELSQAIIDGDLEKADEVKKK